MACRGTALLFYYVETDTGSCYYRLNTAADCIDFLLGRRLSTTDRVSGVTRKVTRRYRSGSKFGIILSSVVGLYMLQRGVMPTHVFGPQSSRVKFVSRSDKCDLVKGRILIWSYWSRNNVCFCTFQYQARLKNSYKNVTTAFAMSLCRT
jgi:hypothetical protein